VGHEPETHFFQPVQLLGGVNIDPSGGGASQSVSCGGPRGPAKKGFSFNRLFIPFTCVEDASNTQI
jgi:hypothetical protein